jgi:hypothetical protein
MGYREPGFAEVLRSIRATLPGAPRRALLVHWAL